VPPGAPAACARPATPGASTVAPTELDFAAILRWTQFDPAAGVVEDGALSTAASQSQGVQDGATNANGRVTSSDSPEEEPEGDGWLPTILTTPILESDVDELVQQLGASQAAAPAARSNPPTSADTAEASEAPNAAGAALAAEGMENIAIAASVTPAPASSSVAECGPAADADHGGAGGGIPLLSEATGFSAVPDDVSSSAAQQSDAAPSTASIAEPAAPPSSERAVRRNRVPHEAPRQPAADRVLLEAEWTANEPAGPPDHAEAPKVPGDVREWAASSPSGEARRVPGATGDVAPAGDPEALDAALSDLRGETPSESDSPAQDFARRADRPTMLAGVARRLAAAASSISAPASPSIGTLSPPVLQPAASAPVYASATPPALPGEHAAQLTRQIVQSVQLQWAQGKGEARMQLTPPDLGHLDVSLRVSEGSVRTIVQASTPEVAGWIEANRDSLKAALADAGLQLDEFTVHADGEREEARPDTRERRRSGPQRGRSDEGRRTFDIHV
jgi:flagellar hook-length control protein FliK